MNEWIKPSQLPVRFHGQCWVVWKSWAGTSYEKIHEPCLYTVQNYFRADHPEYWCEDGYYTSLKENEYRLIILNTPKAPTKQEW